MKILGQIEDACIEQLASDPAANTQGRIFTNTVSGQTKIDDGVNKRALLRNDEKAIIGNHATASNNVRIKRAGSGLFQIVLADDTSLDGVASLAPAQMSSRLENYTDSGKPAFGNPGRAIYVTDLFEVLFDTGAAWVPVNGIVDGTVTFAKLDTDIIASASAVSPALGDYILLQDISDANLTKRALISDALALAIIPPSQLSTPSTATGALSLVAYTTTSTTFTAAGTFNIAASPTVGRPVFINAMPNGFTFTVTAANATAAAVYQTSNGTKFTVNSTIAGATSLLLSMTTPDPGFPNGSTLTKVSGTGDSTITFSAHTPLQSVMFLAENNTANSQGAIVEVVRTSDNKVINSASWGNSNAGTAVTRYTSISLLNCVDPASDGTTAYFVRVRNILTSSTSVGITQALIFGMQL